jgi:hypothetical protein
MDTQITVSAEDAGPTTNGAQDEWRRGVLVVGPSPQGHHITQAGVRHIVAPDDGQALWLAAALVASVELRRAQEAGEAA